MTSHILFNGEKGSLFFVAKCLIKLIECVTKEYGVLLNDVTEGHVFTIISQIFDCYNISKLGTCLCVYTFEIGQFLAIIVHTSYSSGK